MLEFACLRSEPRLRRNHTVQRWGVLLWIPHNSLDFIFLSLCIHKPFTVAACLCLLTSHSQLYNLRWGHNSQLEMLSYGIVATGSSEGRRILQGLMGCLSTSKDELRALLIPKLSFCQPGHHMEKSAPSSAPRKPDLESGLSSVAVPPLPTFVITESHFPHLENGQNV